MSIDATAYRLGWVTATEDEVRRLSERLSAYGDALDGVPRGVIKDAASHLRDAAKILDALCTLDDPDESEHMKQRATAVIRMTP